MLLGMGDGKAHPGEGGITRKVSSPERIGGRGKVVVSLSPGLLSACHGVSLPSDASLACYPVSEPDDYE